MPRPTTAISARPGSISIESGEAFLWIPASISCSFSSNSFWCTIIVIVSIPDGICSNDNPCFSNCSSTRRPNPISEFIISFSILTAENPFLPAIPVIIYSGFLDVLSTIIVPWSSGAFVFLILIGIPSLRTGKIASSWRTVAPMYESSRSSLYVIVLIEAGLSIILGSAIINPDTSVQFS